MSKTEGNALLREAIIATLLEAPAPMGTVAITNAVRDYETHGHEVYRALLAMERAGEVQRAGRAGPAVRAEVLWQLATATGEFNQAFADLLAEFREVSHG